MSRYIVHHSRTMTDASLGSIGVASREPVVLVLSGNTQPYTSGCRIPRSHCLTKNFWRVARGRGTCFGNRHCIQSSSCSMHCAGVPIFSRWRRRQLMDEPCCAPLRPPPPPFGQLIMSLRAATMITIMITAAIFQLQRIYSRERSAWRRHVQAASR